MDFDQARANMIEQQIRTWEVLDQRTLDLFDSIHREEFVPPEYRRLALADTNIPLQHGQITMPPKMEGRIIQELGLSAGERVLEIGTGCAFMTALLCCCAGHVTSVELFPDFTTSARTKLDRYGLQNVDLITADGAHGWATAAPYDAIVVTGSVPALRGDFERQLKTGGRLFIIVGESPVMEAMLIRRIADEQWASEALFETDIPPLLNIPAPPKFSF